MTAAKGPKRRGTPLLDRQFRGIGRIQRACGTHKASERRALNNMLTELFERGQLHRPFHDVLRLIKSGAVTPLETLRAYREGRLEQLTTPRTAAAVEPAWETWVAETRNPKTRRQRAYAGRKLQAFLRPGSTLFELPEALQALRDGSAKQGTTFNRTKAAVQAFLRDRLSRAHPVYLAARAIEPIPVQSRFRPAPTVEQAILIRARLADQASTAADIWWSMYLTGMNPAEFDGAWEVGAQLVSVFGTKRRSRRREVPLVYAPTRRAMGWKQYRAALVATGVRIRVDGAETTVQVNDARRGYEHLLEEAGLPSGRRKLYMGHALNVTEAYGRAELSRYLATDAETIAGVVRGEETRLAAAARKDMRLA